MLKKTIKKIVLVLPIVALMASLLSIVPVSAKGGIFPTPDALCGDFAFPCPEEEPKDGLSMAKEVVANIAANVRYIVGAVAILMIIIAGVKLVVGSGDEEVFKKQKDTILFGIVGLVVIGLAGEISMILDVDKGGFLGDPNVMTQRAKLFARTASIVITLIKYLVGGIATFYTVRNGLRLVLMGGNEEEVTKDKKNVLWSAMGLVLILMADPIINKVFFKINLNQYPGVKEVSPAIDKARLIAEIAGITNIIAAIAGPFALLALVGGGLMYVMGGADEEQTGKAKKIIIGALIGLVCIYGAFAIASTFVARQFEGINQIQ